MSDESSRGGSCRIDVWLWAVRLFKTRSLAADACRNGWVLAHGQPAKPSRQVKPGDELRVRKGDLERTVKVREVLKRRVGAKLVDDFLEDLTPPEVYEQAARRRTEARESTPVRDPGAGRPTKKERRDLEDISRDAGRKEALFRRWMKQSKSE